MADRDESGLDGREAGQDLQGVRELEVVAREFPAPVVAAESAEGAPAYPDAAEQLAVPSAARRASDVLLAVPAVVAAAGVFEVDVSRAAMANRSESPEDGEHRERVMQAWVILGRSACCGRQVKGAARQASAAVDRKSPDQA